MTWSYESSPCNVLVDENLEISAAKSTIAETNKSATSSRPKPSVASTAQSSSVTSSAAAATSSNSQSSGGKLHIVNRNSVISRTKRYRRHILQHDNIFSEISSTITTTITPTISTTITPPIVTSNKQSSNENNLHDSSPQLDGLFLYDSSYTLTLPISSPLSSSLLPSSTLSYSDTDDGNYNDDNESNSNFMVGNSNNDGQIDEGENYTDGYSISVDVDDVSLTTSIVDSSSMSADDNRNGVGNDADVNAINRFFDVTHATNINQNEENLTVTNSQSEINDVQLTTTELLATEFNFANNNDNKLRSTIDKQKDDIRIESDEIGGNDRQTRHTYVRADDNVEFVPLDVRQSINPSNDAYQYDDTDIEIHAIESENDSILLSSDTPALESFPYLESTYPERTRYQVIDANTGDSDLPPPITNNASENVQRILVNVSIATDNGSGTKNHAVYMLHVSVPAGPVFPQRFAANETENNNSYNDRAEHGPPRPPPAPPCPPCSCGGNLDEPSPSLVSDAVIVQNASSQTIDMSSTNVDLDEISESTTEVLLTTAIDDQRSCVIGQEIPMILILEG